MLSARVGATVLAAIISTARSWLTHRTMPTNMTKMINNPTIPTTQGQMRRLGGHGGCHAGMADADDGSYSGRSASIGSASAIDAAWLVGRGLSTRLWNISEYIEPKKLRTPRCTGPVGCGG